MTAECPNDFPYEVASNTSSHKDRETYWKVASGLQAVDGLTPSPYMNTVAQDYIAGKRSATEISELIKVYYREKSVSNKMDATATRANAEHEADAVSCRIVEILDRNAFVFAPFMLDDIHRQLFQDLDPNIYQPGQHKTEQLVKSELILNGDSVLYADSSMIDRALSFAFAEEEDYAYAAEFDDAQIDHLSRFVARLWQFHPFCEGNTRTVAVFTILYLRHLGFDADNDPFENHARYFRDALVRANYRNAKAEALPDRKFLNRFFENLLAGGKNDLRSRDLIVRALYDNPTLLRNVELPKAINRKFRAI